MNKLYLPDGSYSFPCVRADYVAHRLPRYADNPLISALRFPEKRSALKTALNRLPDFDPTERELDRPTRRLQLKQLARFFLGLDRVAELAENIYGNILEGYIGREPHTAAANSKLRTLYEAQKTSDFCSLDIRRNNAQSSCALIGTPGVGKSESLKRVAELFPPMIHHPEFDLWQIPVLNIEMAYNGMSQGTLAHAIIRGLADRFPPGDYARLYLKSHANSEQLLLAAFSLMHVHAVGALVVDEAQNKDYSKETDDDAAEINRVRKYRVSQSPLITLLITASNRMQVPLLMSGTAELRDLMGKRLSKVRRMVGEGMRPWGPLSIVPSATSRHSDYDVYMNLLWRYIWLKNPPEYTSEMRSLFHYYSFGIPDVIVKLFKAVQWRALENQVETFDAALIHDVATREMGAVIGITQNMRKASTDAAARAELLAVTDVAAEFGLTPFTDDFEKRAVTFEESLEESAKAPKEYASTFTVNLKPRRKKKAIAEHTFASPPAADWQEVGK